MDGSDYSRNKNNDHLGINKIGKNIRKSPLHQPNFTNSTRPQTQPQVYNINKNDFRNIVQQLTSSPSQEPLPRPSQNPPKPPSIRLQKIRPPPVTPINRTQIPIPQQMNGPRPSPRSNDPRFPNQHMNAPPFPNGGPPLLPSPTSQFLLPSPTGFGNLLSPRSPYPLLSPGYQFPPPMTPNF